MSYNKTNTENVGLSIRVTPSFVSRDHLMKLKLLNDLLSTDISCNSACNRKRLLPTASFLFRNFLSPYQTIEVTSVTLA
jgi:hypothetical protein